MRTSSLGRGQLDPELGTGLDRPEADRSPVRLHDPPGDEQAEPLPRRPFADHPTGERIEDQVALGRRHPGPPVPHTHPGAVFSLFDEDADRRGLRGVRHGVANDIRDRPPELLLVRVHPDLLRCIEDNDTVIGLRGAARDRIPDDPYQVGAIHAERGRAGGPTQQRTDEIRERPELVSGSPEELLSGGVLIGDADMIQRGARADERGLELVSRTGDRQIEMLVARLRPVDGGDPGERFAQEPRGGPNERLVIGSELGHDHERIACLERIGSASPRDLGEARGETIPGRPRSTASPDVFETSPGASRAWLPRARAQRPPTSRYRTGRAAERRSASPRGGSTVARCCGSLRTACWLAGARRRGGPSLPCRAARRRSCACR